MKIMAMLITTYTFVGFRIDPPKHENHGDVDYYLYFCRVSDVGVEGLGSRAWGSRFQIYFRAWGLGGVQGLCRAHGSSVLGVSFFARFTA